jgi:hemerythrin superfamily protein
MADALEVIEQDHRAVGELFERYQAETDPATRAALVEQIAQGLARHAQMEEQILYPRLEKVLGASLLQQNVSEHNRMREALERLSSLSSIDPSFDLTVEQLMSEVLDHVRLEEEEELPQVRKQLGDEELQRLGQLMQEFRQSQS